MPKIYQYLGFLFFFYSNEHLPIHCHVKRGEHEVKAELEYINGKPIVKFLKIKGSKIFNKKDLNEIEKFIKSHDSGIVEKWTNFFIYGKRPKFEMIKQKK